MKTKILIYVFSIMLCGGIANGQGHVKVFDGPREPSSGHVKGIDGTKLNTPRVNGAAIYRNVNGTWTILSSSTVVGGPVRAGQTIRLRFAQTNNQGKLIVAVDNGVWRQVPCEGGSASMGTALAASLKAIRSGGRGLPQMPVVDILLDPPTSTFVSGTCQMLVLTLSDGSERRARFRFN